MKFTLTFSLVLASVVTIFPIGNDFDDVNSRHLLIAPMDADWSGYSMDDIPDKDDKNDDDSVITQHSTERV